MNGRIIFLLEEPSMRAMLDGLLPRLFPGLSTPENFLCIPHEGKSDLERSIPTKLRAWREPGVRFVVVRDSDGGDCIAVKNRLSRLCAGSNRPETLIRLVCQELESWYLGDLPGLAAAYPDCRVDTPALRKKFAVPDGRLKPSVELKRIVPQFQKLAGARAMAATLNPDRNRSRSFEVFIEGVRRIIGEMDDPETV